jgi:hypothetical protein
MTQGQSPNRMVTRNANEPVFHKVGAIGMNARIEAVESVLQGLSPGRGEKGQDRTGRARGQPAARLDADA